MSSELPDGVTFNEINENKIDLESNNEIIDKLECPSCQLIIESTLSSIGSRNSGKIRTMPQGNIIWENSLPKDREKSFKMLKETLSVKMDKHKERHAND
jgi:hypothetical protein